MKRELLSQAFGDIDEALIVEAYRPVPAMASFSPEKPLHRKKKHIVLLPFAAALILILGITAYAVWSIHITRQQELKTDLEIEENHVSSYREYELPKEQEDGLVLLSSVNEGQWQRIYMDISPVTEEEAVGISKGEVLCSCRIKETDIVCNAEPKMPVGVELSGKDEIQKAVLENAYDKETQTITLECYMDTTRIEKATADLLTESIPIQIDMFIFEEQGVKEHRVFGPAFYSPAEEQKRFFDFENFLYYDEKLDKEVEIVGLELTPFSAVWKIRYEEAGAVHTPGADIEQCRPWLMLEDRLCSEAQILLKDGRIISSGCSTSPYENGIVRLECSWESAINIDDVQRIALGSQILWDDAS